MPICRRAVVAALVLTVSGSVSVFAGLPLADAVAAECGGDATPPYVMLQDYHLYLTPRGKPP